MASCRRASDAEHFVVAKALRDTARLRFDTLGSLRRYACLNLQRGTGSSCVECLRPGLLKNNVQQGIDSQRPALLNGPSWCCGSHVRLHDRVWQHQNLFVRFGRRP